MVIVRVGTNSSDTHAAPTLLEALDLATPDKGNKIYIASSEDTDPGVARLRRDLIWAGPFNYSMFGGE